MLVLVSARALLLVGLLVVTPTLHVRSEQILPLPYNPLQPGPRPRGRRLAALGHARHWPTRTAYTMDHFDGDTLQRYDVDNGWQPLPPLKLSMLLHSTQGADVADGAVWISTSDAHNEVYRVDIATGTTTLAGSLGHEGAEGEGLDATRTPAGQLHAMINDLRQQRVELDHYDVLDETQPAVKRSDTPWGILGVAGVIFGVGIGLAIGLWRLRRAPS